MQCFSCRLSLAESQAVRAQPPTQNIQFAHYRILKARFETTGHIFGSLLLPSCEPSRDSRVLIQRKMNTSPICNFKKKAQIFWGTAERFSGWERKGWMRHRLVLGLTFVASCFLFCMGQRFVTLSLQLGFRRTPCPEAAFGMAWTSHFWNGFSGKHEKWAVHLKGLFAWWSVFGNYLCWQHSHWLKQPACRSLDCRLRCRWTPTRVMFVHL